MWRWFCPLETRLRVFDLIDLTELWTISPLWILIVGKFMRFFLDKIGQVYQFKLMIILFSFPSLVFLSLISLNGPLSISKNIMSPKIGGNCCQLIYRLTFFSKSENISVIVSEIPSITSLKYFYLPRTGHLNNIETFCTWNFLLLNRFVQRTSKLITVAQKSMKLWLAPDKRILWDVIGMSWHWTSIFLVEKDVKILWKCHDVLMEINRICIQKRHSP